MATRLQRPVTSALCLLLLAGCTGSARPDAAPVEAAAPDDPAANPLAGAFYYEPPDGLFYEWQFTDDAFDPASVAELVHTLESSPDELERRTAAYRLGERCFGRSDRGMRFVWPGREQIEAMIAAVAEGRTGAQAKALVPILTKSLDDPSRDVRQCVASSFVRIGPVAAEAAPRLRAALGDADPFVRLWAARALHEITLEAEPPLRTSLAALADPDPKVRTMAVYNLELMESDARPALGQLQELAESDPLDDVRRQARQAVDTLSR